MAAKIPDGTLRDWHEVEGEENWQVLLLGNGLSINVWEPFGYRKLYDQAKDRGLTAADRRLFASTPNFERVLSDLLTAIRVAEASGMDAAPLYERYRSIQAALGHAIREVHLNRDLVPGTTRTAIREVIEGFEWIFTTSYDLLLYWAMAYPGRFEPFIDHFRWGGNCEFDPSRADVHEDEVPIYFLHGALHLVVSGSGVTWKLRRGRIQTLLDQFGQPIEGDPQARPLLVTEGSAQDKLNAIDDNDYLRFALNQLRQVNYPLVVFGSGLSEHDQHLVDAINEYPRRPVAISMLPDYKPDLAKKQIDLYGRLASEPIFFDATTHPLGSEDLRVPAP